MDGLQAHLYLRYLLIDGFDFYTGRLHDKTDKEFIIYFADKSQKRYILKKVWSCQCCRPVENIEIHLAEKAIVKREKERFAIIDLKEVA